MLLPAGAADDNSVVKLSMYGLDRTLWGDDVIMYIPFRWGVLSGFVIAALAWRKVDGGNSPSADDSPWFILVQLLYRVVVVVVAYGIVVLI